MEAGLQLRISETHLEFARSCLVVESNPEQTVVLRVFEAFQRLAGQRDGARSFWQVKQNHCRSVGDAFDSQ